MAGRGDREIALAPASHLIEVGRVGGGENLTGLPVAVPPRRGCGHSIMIRQLPTSASMRPAENLPARDESTSSRDEHARHSDEPRAGAADSPRGRSAAGRTLILPGPNAP